MNKNTLREDIRFLKSMIKAIDDIENGRVEPFEFKHIKADQKLKKRAKTA